MSSEESGKGAGKHISYLQPLPGFFTSFKNDRQVFKRNSPLPSFLSGGKHT